ncbi:hypothetical protein [Vitiosangium sp. GDMCC 1.1324]|uniref:hypothetical protein n=1 Tax=Vitiosangium sp. (strain GDMCC 1.1324) TaxID=2138576 RepID=UPI000D3C763D|nr:hypothetical protein [Vitiosangium sp. GDMCC 1.1324]PTL82091.1 hypothetical protein DAT35_20025 [Vitiosangium sp. GDMCC 1.1324]
MRLASVLPVCALLSLVACAPPTFTAEVKGETTVPAAPGGIGTLLEAFPAIGSFSSLDFDQNQDFQNQGVTKEQVSSAKLQSLQLKVLAPADQDFSFLDTVEFYAKTGDREVLVASKHNIASLGLKAPNPVLALDLEDVDLQPFITAPSMSISVRGKGRMPSKEVRLLADVKLDVQVRTFN